MKKTIIAWTDATFNVAWGCMKTSPGCTNCYADDLSQRYQQSVTYWGPKSQRRVFGDEHWIQPLKWNARAEKSGKQMLVFSSSMCDLFEDHPVITQERNKLWALIRRTPRIGWQLLTKRSERIADNLPSDWGAAGYKNVWLGVSIENADYAYRADDLRKIPAVVRFISYEPALGPLDNLDLTGIDWVIYGGESGPKFRPEDKQWARTMLDKCKAAGVAFFHKQSASRFTERGIELDGKIVREYPTPLRLE